MDAEPSPKTHAQKLKHQARCAWQHEQPTGFYPISGLITGLFTALFWWLIYKMDGWWGNGDGALAGWPILTLLWPFAILAGIQKALEKSVVGHVAGLLSFLLFLWMAIQFIGWHVFGAWPLASLDDEKAALISWLQGVFG